MSVARRISSASLATLFLHMVRPVSDQLLRRTLSEQDRGMRLLQNAAKNILTQSRQQLVVVETETADQGVGAGELYQLGGRQAQNDIRDIGIKPQSVHTSCIIVAQQTLCQHEVRKINFLDITQSTIFRRGHGPIPSWLAEDYNFCLSIAICNCKYSFGVSAPHSMQKTNAARGK